MAKTRTDPFELTYPLRAAARLTGLSPGLLRAWERRYGVVEPRRTPGGTRRYSAADLERLRLVKAAVDAGHRISQVANLEIEDLKRCSGVGEVGRGGRLEEILAAVEQLAASETQRLLSLQISTLGISRFVREVAIPLVERIGELWEHGKIGVAQEHLATGVLRSMMGSSLQPSAVSMMGPRVVFATPSGERHELGLLMAALTALGAGADPIYLGPDVPVEDLLAAVDGSGAAALALSIATLPIPQAGRAVRALRGGLPDDVALWLGGAGSERMEPIGGTERIGDLDRFEQRVMLFALSNADAT